ncbi:MAG: hypothetical protein GY835_02170 [bacterium]|nr:hypothetical protein [bacterium]
MNSKTHFARLGLLLLAALVLYLGCSSSSDPADTGNPVTSETIGAIGGAIEIADAVTMIVPPGAVAGDVNFTMNQANNPDGMVAVRALGSAVYSIGPSGTTFDEPVTLELHYDEADLGGVSESEIIIYTDSGAGWTPLPTTVDEVNNIASAEIYHLSDFAVTTPAGEAADGVFAIFEIVRLRNDDGLLPRIDIIAARFDGVVNPCSPVEPLHPTSVSCNEYDLVYDDILLGYLDTNDPGEFLTLGDTYTYTVEVSDDVPAITRSIDMVDVEPAITNIEMFDVLSAQGFTVEWNDTSDDSVTLALALSDEMVVSKRLRNSGSYTFTANDLQGVEPGIYALALVHYVKEYITDVAGYDPASYILASSDDTKVIRITSDDNVIGEVGGVLLLGENGEDGRLTIASGTLSENVTFTIEVNATPTTTENYTFLSPVYSMGPDGTPFDGDGAQLCFFYDDNDLGEALEEDIVVLVDEGFGWEELNTDIMESNNWANAVIAHLSDYVVAVPVPHTTEGVYAEMFVMRSHSVFEGLPDINADFLQLRFDEVAGDEPVTPLQAGTATFGAWPMVWRGDESSDDYYDYEQMGDPEFLTVGNDYSLNVTSSGAVPALVLQVPFPTAPAIANVGPGDILSLDGFTLEWDDYLPGSTVEIRILAGATGAMVVAPNTGSYTFSAAELEGIDSEYPAVIIQLAYVAEVPIVADGFDSESIISYMTTSQVIGVTFGDTPVEPITVTYTSTPSMAIPYGSTATDVINVPVTGTVQSIRVYHDVSASWMSDQTTVLHAPGGVNCRVLWIASGGETDGHYSGWYPTTYDPGEYGDDSDFTPFVGESINGTWSLACRDYSQGADDGVLNEWRIEITYTP